MLGPSRDSSIPVNDSRSEIKGFHRQVSSAYFSQDAPEALGPPDETEISIPFISRQLTKDVREWTTINDDEPGGSIQIGTSDDLGNGIKGFHRQVSSAYFSQDTPEPLGPPDDIDMLVPVPSLSRQLTKDISYKSKDSYEDSLGPTTDSDIPSSERQLTNANNGRNLSVHVSDIGPTELLTEPSPSSLLLRQITKDISYNSADNDDASISISTESPLTSAGRQLKKDASELNCPVNVLMIGSGEYTTGFVPGKKFESDKNAGVVALTMFDLRQRGKVGRIGLCGVNGKKFVDIRGHMERSITDVYGLSVELETFPADTVSDPTAYLAALQDFVPGDCVTVFTPDDTHFEIALACVERGLHVLVSKPIVKTLAEHRQLMAAAARKGVIVATEVHKRWDPIYVDARDRIRNLGAFSYFYSYMSQPKFQLSTFSGWAGKSSDISYYLNAHHVDFLEWSVYGRARPVQVVGTASTGVAEPILQTPCEDTITLTVTWESTSGHRAQSTSVHTSSWIAPRSDVHSQQRFFYMGAEGELTVDQAHRGYTLADDSGSGLRSLNPLFMKYVPSDKGKFSGQSGYGYRSLEAFVDRVMAHNQAQRWASTGYGIVSEESAALADIGSTLQTTAILEAGRRSIDAGGRPVRILYGDKSGPCQPTDLELL